MNCTKDRKISINEKYNLIYQKLTYTLIAIVIHQICMVLCIHLWCLSLSVLLVLWLQDLTKHTVAPPPAVVPPVSDWPTFPNCWPLLPPGPRAKSWRSALRSGPLKFSPQEPNMIWDWIACFILYLILCSKLKFIFMIYKNIAYTDRKMKNQMLVQIRYIGLNCFSCFMNQVYDMKNNSCIHRKRNSKCFINAIAN